MNFLSVDDHTLKNADEYGLITKILKENLNSEVSNKK